MSDGFAGSETKSMNVEREIETKMKKLQLVGRVQGRYGSVEIHKDPITSLFLIRDEHNQPKGNAKSFEEARNKAHQVVQQKPRDAMMKKMDAFQDVQPYQDVEKGSEKYFGEYQDKHTENMAKEHGTQEAMDVMDRMEQIIEGGIKPPSEQFPAAGDDAAWDARQADPNTMSLEDKVEQKLRKK